MFWPRKKMQQQQLDASLPEPVAAMQSDTGCQRELNEDSARITRLGNGRLLVVVADGMGGHQAGEVASRMAVETIEEHMLRMAEPTGKSLAAAFEKAHRSIFECASSVTGMAGMGTTCTALLISGCQAWAAHVGDSRLYLIRRHAIYQLTEDHTRCMEMVRQGILTLAEAREHEDRNVLLHAMGTRKELTLMTWPEPMGVRRGDLFVLCSDGLHDRVADAEIRDVAAACVPEESCRKLVKMARERGGYDNITVAVVVSPGEPLQAVSPKETRQYEVIP